MAHNRKGKIHFDTYYGLHRLCLLLYLERDWRNALSNELFDSPSNFLLEAYRRLFTNRAARKWELFVSYQVQTIDQQ